MPASESRHVINYDPVNKKNSVSLELATTVARSTVLVETKFFNLTNLYKLRSQI